MGATTLIKKLCIPFRSTPLQIRGGSEPRRPTAAHFTGNEVLSAAAVSLCSRLAQLCLRLLFDPNRTQGGAVWLGQAGVGAQGTDRVVTRATEAAFKGGGGERPRLVIPTKRARAEVTEGRGRGAANTAVVPRTFPTSCTQTQRLLWRKSSSFKPTKGLQLNLRGYEMINQLGKQYMFLLHKSFRLLRFNKENIFFFGSTSHNEWTKATRD